MLIEVPVGNIESVIAAHKGGAGRIELCSALPLGGLTPSIGMIESISEIRITKFVMIRPREGDFVFSSSEFNCMLKDIEHFRNTGAEGIVSGILLQTGKIDVERTKELIAATRPLSFTFHRAFDLTVDAFHSLEILIELKVDRLLTSGQASDAYSGRELISELVFRANNKIIIMPGAGINHTNARSIVDSTGVKEIHLSGKKRKNNGRNNSAVKMGNEDDYYEVTDETVIRQVAGIFK